MNNMPQWWARMPWWGKALIVVFHPLLIVIYVLVLAGWAVGIL